MSLYVLWSIKTNFEILLTRLNQGWQMGWVKPKPCVRLHDSRIDYCNAVYAMSPQTITNRMQRVMNAAPQIVSDTGKYDCWLKTYYTTSSTSWMSMRRLNSSSLWRCTGVCMTWRLGTSLITSSEPLMLLLAVFVYNPLTWIVSLFLAIDLSK